MKYQSELIKEIVESRGHEMSSTHYESECVESWIEETKGAYPKLCDYQSEWLNYISEKPIGIFPYEIITDITDATVNNVVPYEYKSAILKGQTLVNISSLTGEITIKPNSTQFIESSLIQQNKTYTFMFNCTSAPSTGFIEFRQILDNNALKMENINVVQGYNKFKVTAVNKEVNKFRLKNESTSNTDFVFNNLMVIEGDYTNVDIPYFEGMQSVKMPVLKTTGKNLFNKNNIIVDGYIISNGTLVYETGDNRNAADFTEVEANCIYSISGIKNSAINGGRTHQYLCMYDKNKKFISSSSIYCLSDSATFTTTENTKYIRVSVRNDDINRLQIEKGTTATTYEPHKSNILTVNEDVTLRSNGDVYDELNLLTGRLTQRIAENNEVLAQAVVKTVDLSIEDQDGNTLRKIKPIEGTMNIHSDGTPLKPTITMEIPVEATTQNLASFIKEE